jgi:hypothetical protein
MLQALCAAALSCAVASAYADRDKDESGHGRGGDRKWSEKDDRHGRDWKEKKDWREGKRGHERRGGSYFHEHGYSRLNIPPGHYPPPGKCRAWYPDRPPGQQPPPGDCRSVPPGAWLLRHPQDRPGHVHVTVFEPRRPGTVLVVGEFEIASGAFMRVVLQK